MTSVVVLVDAMVTDSRIDVAGLGVAMTIMVDHVGHAMRAVTTAMTIDSRDPTTGLLHLVETATKIVLPSIATPRGATTDTAAAAAEAITMIDPLDAAHHPTVTMEQGTMDPGLTRVVLMTDFLAVKKLFRLTNPTDCDQVS